MKFCGVLFTILANISCSAIKRYIFLKNAYCKTLWKNIQSGWERFSHCIRFEVGNAWCTRFWYHVWCGKIPLKEAFPVRFKLLRAKKLILLILSVGTMGDIVWDVIFTRSLHDWELGAYRPFFIFYTPTTLSSKWRIGYVRSWKEWLFCCKVIL